MKKEKILNDQEVLNKVIDDIAITRLNRIKIPKYAVLYDLIESIPSEFISRVKVELNKCSGYYILYLDDIKVCYLDTVEFVTSTINHKCNKEVSIDMMNEGMIVIEFIRDTNKFKIYDYSIDGFKEYELKKEIKPLKEGDMPF
jgi:hypothetical protein